MTRGWLDDWGKVTPFLCETGDIESNMRMHYVC